MIAIPQEIELALGKTREELTAMSLSDFARFVVLRGFDLRITYSDSRNRIGTVKVTISH